MLAGQKRNEIVIEPAERIVHDFKPREEGWRLGGHGDFEDAVALRLDRLDSEPRFGQIAIFEDIREDGVGEGVRAPLRIRAAHIDDGEAGVRRKPAARLRIRREIGKSHGLDARSCELFLGDEQRDLASVIQGADGKADFGVEPAGKIPDDSEGTPCPPPRRGKRRGKRREDAAKRVVRGLPASVVFDGGASGDGPPLVELPVERAARIRDTLTEPREWRCSSQA